MLKHFLFLHIPKAGGMTLRTTLSRQFYGQKIHLIKQRVNKESHAFMQLEKPKAQEVNLLMGHFRYGIHTQFERDFTYLTMLREPVARVMSEYTFLHTNEYHHLYQYAKKMSVSDYLASGMTDQISNGMVRMLSGAETMSADGMPQRRDMTEADLSVALENIEQHFAQVGFIEHYDKSVLLWKRAFNWRYPIYFKENMTLKSSKRIIISDNERDKIKQMNQLDIKLYESLLARFEVKVSELGAGLKAQLAWFKMLNFVYGIYVRIRFRLGYR